jgi:hypothetical protein
MMVSKPTRRLLASVLSALMAACLLVGACQSKAKRTVYVPRDDDVTVRAPGTAVDVTDDDVYVNAPFVSVRVRR